MIKIYAYPACSTCKKALKLLDENNIIYELVDIKLNNPGYEEIKKIYESSNLDIKKFFNTSGLVYKDLKLKDKLKEMTTDEKLKILSKNGMLIKRPILITDKIILLGYKEEEYQKAIN